MRKFQSQAGNPILLLTLFSLVLGATLFYLGPLLAVGSLRPFDPLSNRLIAVGAIAAATVITILLILLRRHRRERELTETITAQPAAKDRTGETVTAELAELRKRMTEALGVLRHKGLRGRLGMRHLYQLPWYIIIGPPGAGKTTAIVNSGLHFPLADRMGKNAIKGVGGTRNCDWWFTDEAVLLDTAGRYTTQDSNRDADAGAWSGFLDMLKKHRRRQPVNGAIIAISLSDLSVQDEETRRDHATAIRTRLHELRERLGLRFPVYILFTKADLIAGFQQFFDNLGAVEREQVWGVTFPHDRKEQAAAPMESFNNEFDVLLAQLSNLGLERMQAETDYQRRSLIAGFPAQMASLRDVAGAFLTDIFRESRYEDNQLLRGVYFTSGTQEGTPIDRLMTGMSQTFGIGRQAIGSGQGRGRSYFLTRLMNGVIFREAGLVSADDKLERRHRWVRRGLAAACVISLIGSVTLWGSSFLGNRDLIAAAGNQLNTFELLSREIPRSPIADADLPPVVPALNRLRDLPGNPAASDPKVPVKLTFGLYQGDAIGTESAQAYRGALNAMLLPRLLFRLEDQIQNNMNNKEFLFEALKVYLMLGLQGPMDARTVEHWMRADWALSFPEDDTLRADLAGHLEELVNQPMREIALNGPLLDQVRALLAETPLAERIYQGIVKAPGARALQPFLITTAGGPAVSRVMLRASGQPLSAGIDGVYTHDGFHDYFLPQLRTVEDRVRFQNLVLGPRAVDVNPQVLERLERDVLALYENDFVTQYDELLGDVDIIPMEGPGQAAQVVNVLSGPASPIRNILELVARETRLTVLPGQQQVAQNASSAAADLARSEVISSLDAQEQAVFDALSSAVSGGGGTAEPERPGRFVEERFAALHDAVDGIDGTTSRMDDVLQRMTRVFDALNRISLGQNSGSGIAGQGQTAVQELQVTLTQLPNPLQRWAAQVVAASSGAAAGGVRSELNAKWKADVLPFCKRALKDRYPFVRQAKADVALQDFGRLFAPDGLIDSFFKNNLARFVDTSTNPWRAKRVNGADIGISNAVIAQFQKASEIRDSFFLSPGLPSITFDIKPVALDPNVEQAILEIEGQPVTYAHGPPEVTPLTWPGQNSGRTRVAFTPARLDVNNSIQREGPWSLFRLLDTAEVRRTNVSDRNRVIFNLGGRIAIYQLRTGSALNPFTNAALNSFTCPGSL
nr:type VI secretion system membrane subunit TssM [Roseibium sp. RKSG952]